MSKNRSENLAVVVPFEGRQVSSCRQSLERRIEPDLAMAKQTGRRLSVFCIRINCNSDPSGEVRRETLAVLFRKMQMHLSSYPSSTDQVIWPWSDGLAITHAGAQEVFGIYQHAWRLLQNLERMIHHGESSPQIDVSVGIAVYPYDGSEVSSLLDHARVAAKRAGHWERSGFCFFSRSMGREVADKLTRDVSLVRAFKAGSVAIQFQPVIDLRHSCMIGVSGMPAWHHPTLGSCDADEIMESVERAKITSVYNAWMTDQICRQSSAWCQGHHRRRIGVEVTRSQLVDAPLVKQFSETLGKYSCSSDLIDIAIDGTLLVDATDHRLRTELEQLVGLGVQLTVANVGIQPLPLEALKTLPLNAIEFAPELVSPIGRCRSSERTLAALIGLFSNLGMKTRATAVRSEEQLEFLISNDCDEATGPLLAPPMRGDDIDRLTIIRPCVHPSNSQGFSERQRQRMH